MANRRGFWLYRSEAMQLERLSLKWYEGPTLVPPEMLLLETQPPTMLWRSLIGHRERAMWRTTEAQTGFPAGSQHHPLGAQLTPRESGDLQSWIPPTSPTCITMSQWNCFSSPLSSGVVSFTAFENWSIPQNIFMEAGGEIGYKRLILISVKMVVIEFYVSSRWMTTKWMAFASHAVLNLRIWQHWSKEFLFLFTQSVKRHALVLAWTNLFWGVGVWESRGQLTRFQGVAHFQLSSWDPFAITCLGQQIRKEQSCFPTYSFGSN